MKATKDKIEDLFPSVYITLFSILLGFAIEDMVTQLRETAPIDAYSSLSAIAILSALISGWIGLSFVAIGQDRLPKIQDVLNVLGEMTVDEITGGSPYGASTIAGPDGSRMPSKNELEIAKFQGRHVAEIVKKLER